MSSCADPTRVSARATAERAPRVIADSIACCLVMGCWLRATDARKKTRPIAEPKNRIRKFTPRNEDKPGGPRAFQCLPPTRDIASLPQRSHHGPLLLLR